MSPRTVLDQQLLDKLATKSGKEKQYLREEISRRASRFGLDSKVVQILWAKQLGIGTTRAQQALDAHLQEQVRDGLPTVFAGSQRSKSSAESGAAAAKGTNKTKKKAANPIQLAIDFLITDPELKSRCGGLLKARRHHDTALREATTVLETRIKNLSATKKKMNPADLVGKAVNPDPDKAILVASDDRAEQEGFHSLCKGLMLTFRNPAHHNLDDKLSQLDALRLCAFIDVLLAILDKADVHTERA